MIRGKRTHGGVHRATQFARVRVRARALASSSRRVRVAMRERAMELDDSANPCASAASKEGSPSERQGGAATEAGARRLGGGDVAAPLEGVARALGSSYGRRIKRPSERGMEWAKRVKAERESGVGGTSGRDGAGARDERWCGRPTRRGEYALAPGMVSKLAKKLPYGLEFVGVDGPIAHVSRDGALYGRSEEEQRRWQAHNVTSLGVADDFVPDFGFVDGVVGVPAKKGGVAPMAVNILAADPRGGLLGGALTRPPSRPASRGPATQSKRAKAEERAKKVALRKRLTELEHLLDNLAQRAHFLMEQRDELSLISQRANAALNEIDNKRKASSVSRGISAIRQKLGCKTDTQVGFDTLRYRALLEVVHKQCLTAVRQLISHKWGFPFATPVDPVALGLPTYFDIIKEPMDLGLIKKLIEDGGKYVAAEGVDADVRLTFANAMKFNAEGTDVHTMARELLAEWESKWESIKERIAEVEACLLVERELAEAKNEAASRRADVVNKEKECARVSEALDLVSNQLREVESQVLTLMRPLQREDRLNLASELRSMPDGLRDGAKAIVSANTTGWSVAAHLEDVDAHNDVTIHLLARYAKTMNRNRIALTAGWCGAATPKHLLAKFKEPLNASTDAAMATFVIGQPFADELETNIGLRSIDAMHDDYDFDPAAFDDLLGSVDVAGMDIDLDL